MATGINNLPNPGMVFNPFDILTAEEMNELVENIEDLATGSGIGDGALDTNTYKDASVTPNKLGLGQDAAHVATGQSTSSTSFADLATTTDQVTVNIGSKGVALVSIASTMFGAPNLCVGFAISGATTVAASEDMSVLINNVTSRQGATYLVTGLTPGSNTFKMKYKVSSGTGTFVDRRISVVPL